MKRLTAQLSGLAVGVGARSTHFLSVLCSLCLPALPPLTDQYLCYDLFTSALLQAKTVACLALPKLSLLACAHSTDSLVCALFACLRSLAGCCLPLLCCCVHHSHTFRYACSLHLRSLLDCDCCLPCLSSLALPVRRLRDDCTSARAFRSCPCTSTSAGQARQDKAQNQFVFNIRRARNALLPLSCSAAAAAIVAAEQRRSQRTESASLLSLVFVRRSLCQQRVAPPVTHTRTQKHIHVVCLYPNTVS